MFSIRLDFFFLIQQNRKTMEMFTTDSDACFKKNFLTSDPTEGTVEAGS